MAAREHQCVVVDLAAHRSRRLGAFGVKLDPAPLAFPQQLDVQPGREAPVLPVAYSLRSYLAQFCDRARAAQRFDDFCIRHDRHDAEIFSRSVKMSSATKSRVSESAAWTILFIMYEGEDDEAIGQRLKLLRQAAGKTQKEMADIFGLSSAGGWANYEKGERSPPRHTLFKICDEYDIPTDWVLRGRPRTLTRQFQTKAESRGVKTEAIG